MSKRTGEHGTDEDESPDKRPRLMPPIEDSDSLTWRNRFVAMNKAALEEFEKFKPMIKETSRGQYVIDAPFIAHIRYGFPYERESAEPLRLQISIDSSSLRLPEIWRPEHQGAFPIYSTCTPHGKELYVDCTPCWDMCTTLEERKNLALYAESAAERLTHMNRQYQQRNEFVNQVRNRFLITTDGPTRWTSSSSLRSFSSIEMFGDNSIDSQRSMVKFLVEICHPLLVK